MRENPSRNRLEKEGRECGADDEGGATHLKFGVTKLVPFFNGHSFELMKYERMPITSIFLNFFHFQPWDCQ